MKKKNFVALLFGTIGGLLFSLGMCMALLPEWGMFNQEIICGAIGAIVLLITAITYRKMSGKAPIKVNMKVVGIVLLLLLIPMCIGLKDDEKEEA